MAEEFEIGWSRMWLEAKRRKFWRSKGRDGRGASFAACGREFAPGPGKYRRDLLNGLGIHAVWILFKP